MDIFSKRNVTVEVGGVEKRELIKTLRQSGVIVAHIPELMLQTMKVESERRILEVVALTTSEILGGKIPERVYTTHILERARQLGLKELPQETTLQLWGQHPEILKTGGVGELALSVNRWDANPTETLIVVSEPIKVFRELKDFWFLMVSRDEERELSEIATHAKPSWTFVSWSPNAVWLFEKPLG